MNIYIIIIICTSAGILIGFGLFKFIYRDTYKSAERKMLKAEKRLRDLRFK